jgi:quaternary ammonium compound-resistance protein SugE
MSWFYLFIAGLFEMGWPVGLKLGWTKEGIRVAPLCASGICMLMSGIFLLLSLRTIPMGTAYAVWTGLGAIGTFLIGLAAFNEPATAARLMCVGLIAAGILGLKVSGE